MIPRVVPPLKTARFSGVVAKSGRPSVHLTLVAPAKDPALRRLDGQGRVMTVFPARRGAGTDYGLVGIHPAPAVQVLVFPRSVRRFAGKRIVGINYDLLDQDIHVTGRPAARALRQGNRLRPPPKPAAVSPKRAPIPAPAPVREQARPTPEPPEPPALPVVLRRLRAIERLFNQKRAAAARDETSRLVQDLAQALEPAKRRPRH